MYGDPAKIEELAKQPRRAANDVQDECRARLNRAEAAEWRSTAADTWRDRVRDEAGDGNPVATQLEEAADALDAHAGTCRERLELIAQAERNITGWISDRRAQLQHVASGVADDVAAEATQALSAVDTFAAGLPGAGDLDWLRVGSTPVHL